MQTDLLIALLDIEIEMCVFMFNNNLPVMQAADEILPVFHWTDQKSDLVELVRYLQVNEYAEKSKYHVYRYLIPCSASVPSNKIA